MTCERPFPHAPHYFIADDGTDDHCDGTHADLNLAWLLAQRPELNGVGTATQVAAIGVAAA